MSVAILELPSQTNRACSIVDAGNIIAMLKKEAKTSGNKIAYASIMVFLSRDMRGHGGGGL